MSSIASPTSPRGAIRQRGLLEGNFSPRSLASMSPFQLSSAKKHKRWWNIIYAVIVLVCSVEIVLFLVSVILLSLASEPITFGTVPGFFFIVFSGKMLTYSILLDLQKYPKIPYQPLDTTITITLPVDSSVYHVTKEFGPATMGGMGTVLTSLTQAQLRTGKIQPYVVLPFYSFLRKQEQYPIKKTIDLVTTVYNEQGESIPFGFRVSQIQYDFQPMDNFNSLTDEEKQQIHAQQKRTPSVTVYLIGHGKMDPLRKAFRCNTITQIYSSPRGLPQEWKDQYFTKAVASFLIWKHSGKHEQSLFAPLDSRPRVDVVHLHGATNAYVSKFLKEVESQMGSTPPTIVYTMHDYLDELQYTNTLPNVEKFLNPPKQARSMQQEVQKELIPYTFGGNKVFMSPMAIDKADVVTFVSQAMAKDMVEGNLEFYLKEVVMEKLLRKAETQQFYGVSNGVDFTGTVNPFTETKLINAGLNFPDYAKDLINLKLNKGHRDTNMVLDATESLAANVWALSSQKSDFVTEAKQQAKQFLIEQGLLNAEDLDRPLVLFVGRFQYNKGLETFEEAAKLLQSHNMKFAIIGQPNNYPLKWVEQLAAKYPKNIVMMSQISQQRKWLIYFRAAADFIYVPSITESFGLVAAEGLLFGSSVISTGTGGLAEFLVDRTLDLDAPAEIISNNYVQSHYRYNAYLFDALATSGENQLSKAIERAAEDYKRMRLLPASHETYVLRMMLSAYSLGWDRLGDDQGPVYDYLRIYQQAIYDKRARSSYNLLEDNLETRK
jgi:glycogen synthase